MLPKLPIIFLLGVIGSLLVSCVNFAPPPPTLEPVTLQFSYMGSKADYEALAEQFHKQYPHITIELKPLSPYRNEINLQVELLKALDTADVARRNLRDVGPEEIAKLRPIGDLLLVDQAFKKEDLFPGLLEALQTNGKQLGIPAGIDPMVMFYENLRFQIAKSAPPQVDYTLEQFMTAVQAVNNPWASAPVELSYGFCTAPGSFDAAVFAYLFGGGLFDRFPDPTRPVFNSPSNVQALEWYAGLWTADPPLAPPVTDRPYGIYGHINLTRCGFWLQYLDMMDFMGANTTEMRVLPLPRVMVPFGLATLDGYFLTSASQHTQEAWQWISFLAQDQSASLALIPPYRTQIASDGYAQRASAGVLAVARSLPDNTVMMGLDFVDSDPQADDIPLSSQVYQLFTQAVLQVVNGEVDAQTALNDAQKQAEIIFSERK